MATWLCTRAWECLKSVANLKKNKCHSGSSSVFQDRWFKKKKFKKKYSLKTETPISQIRILQTNKQTKNKGYQIQVFLFPWKFLSWLKYLYTFSLHFNECICIIHKNGQHKGHSYTYTLPQSFHFPAPKMTEINNSVSLYKWI